MATSPFATWPPLNKAPVCGRCPSIFGLGHQKSGTTTVLFALGSAANLTVNYDMTGFWLEPDLSDHEVCRALDPNAVIQKAGHAWKYVAALKSICPTTALYVVKRNALDVIRSVADRLQLHAGEGCEDSLGGIPKGWQPLFRYSNDTSCLVRLAASVVHMARTLATEAPEAPRIQYEDYVKAPTSAIGALCASLGVECNATRLDVSQKQRKGKHHGVNASTLWPATYVKRIRAVLDHPRAPEQVRALRAGGADMHRQSRRARS